MEPLLGELFCIGRKRLGLSQSAAARELDITQPYISSIERNKAVPAPRLRERMRALYKIDPLAIEVALLGRDGPRPKGGLPLWASVLLGLASWAGG